MFQTSKTYDELSAVCGSIKGLMQVQLINDFVDHLHYCYEHRNGNEEKSFLVWLGERGSYSHVAGGRDPMMAMYDVMEVVREAFGQERDFQRGVEDQLNDRFGEQNSAKLSIHLEEIDESWNELHELFTFDYDPVYAWGD